MISNCQNTIHGQSPGLWVLSLFSVSPVSTTKFFEIQSQKKIEIRNHKLEIIIVWFSQLVISMKLCFKSETLQI